LGILQNTKMNSTINFLCEIAAAEIQYLQNLVYLQQKLSDSL